ncbi:BatD family protein [Candidatus Thiosymbion oneisti]|uniref:BatD family protein n=1 Tax=Candidatus Thiosymbion oneisti TaxID=589554 RepID=UPI000B7E8DB5|nr:BatD family protein [Candidatus Thiosymbion oneisti]
MRQLNTLYLLILILLAATVEVQAFTFTAPFPGASGRDQRPPQGPESWQYRPQDSSNARGIPPGYQPPGQPPGAPSRWMPGQTSNQPPGTPPHQMPGQRPGYQYGWPGQYQTPYGQPAARQAEPLVVELELSDHQPYVQENVLLKLRVVSDRNLATATPELPNSNDVLLQKIGDPKAYSRTGAQGSREIVNEFVYILTPLRAGTIEVPPLRVTGTLYGNGLGYGPTGNRRFEATSVETTRLQVRPAMASVRPWLPLQDLTLKATLDGDQEVEQGKPVTLTLELTAVGATGDQLPSLESLLHSPDFRVYREQTLNEGHLSQDGRRLEGRRTEYFTLVPRAGGRLQLPEIRLPWWNVTTGTKEYAGLPIHTLQVDGETGRFGLSPSAATTGGGGLSWFWLPLAGIVFLLLGYWGGVWYQRRAPRVSVGTGGGPALRERLGTGLTRLVTTVATNTAELTKRMDPTPLFGRIRSRLSSSLPPSTRFLRCVHAANQEDEPAAWAERFQDLTRRYLQFDTRTPLPGITGKILALRPGADPQQLGRLMQQLDGALYGNQDIDFTRWKKQFHNQIGRRRGLISSSGRGLHLTRARLPALNPQTG